MYIYIYIYICVCIYMYILGANWQSMEGLPRGRLSSLTSREPLKPPQVY